MTTPMTSTPSLTPEPSNLSGLIKLPKYSERFTEVLKDRAPQFMSSMLQVGRKLGPDCEPLSIIGSAMVAAALNLPIDPNLGFAWIVPYKNKGVKMAQFQMGWKGYVQLALRTGQYSRLNVCEVYEGELQGMDKLTGDITIDVSKKKSDKVIGYASYMRLVSGFEHAEYWTVDAVEAHAKRYSQSFAKGYDGPWKTHFHEMAKKTVLSMHIRRWGPMSIDVQKAHAADQAVIRDVDSEPEFVDNGPKAVDVPSLEDSSEQPENQQLVAGRSQQENLINLLGELNIPASDFITFINVNEIDKALGFDASTLGSILEWPDSACAKIASDSSLLARIARKYKK